MARRPIRKLILSSAAAALVAGAAAPAMAGGTHVSVGYHSGYYGGGYYNAGYYGHHGHHGHYRGHRRHHRHHGHGGGKAAAIALGVIGGAIILNELAEDRARDRYYEDRYYERRARYDRYARRAVPYNDEPAYVPDDGRDYEAAPEDSDLERRLEGGPADGGPEPIRVSYASAYNACIRHAREALGNRGYVLSAPYKPETAEDLGGSWKMTATVTAQKGADGWSRAMYCEAADNRVYLLELI